MADVKVSIRENGPYRVEGPIVLVDMDGKEYDLRSRDGSVSLCRCGSSSNKPFCDGTHRQVGFSGAERAPDAS
jgi:CDGSH-type Zn-finger protein